MTNEKHNFDLDNLFTMSIDKISSLLYLLVSVDLDYITPDHDPFCDEFIDASAFWIRFSDDDDRVVDEDTAKAWTWFGCSVFGAMEKGVPFEMCIKEIDRQRDLYKYEFPDCSNGNMLLSSIERSLFTLHKLLPDEPTFDLNTGWTVADLQRQWVKHALKEGLSPRQKATVEIFLIDLMKRAQSSEGDISMSTQLGPLIMFHKDEALGQNYTPQREQIISDVFEVWANTIDAQVEKTKQAVLDLFNYARQPKRNKVKLKRADEEPSH